MNHLLVALCRCRATALLYLCLDLLLARPGHAQPGRRIPGLPYLEWQTPRLTGYGLQAAHLFNDSTAIVVGTHGTALKTSNKGRTWQTLDVGTTNDLMDVQFVNASVGWVTYGIDDPATPTFPVYQLHGEVRRTIDGGRTWAVQRTGEPRYANPVGNLQMQSPTDGFLLYGLWVPGSGGPPEGRLRRTTDGGQTWTLVGPVPVGSAFNAMRCQFFGPQVGYAVGAAVVKTTDGGLTWRSVMPPGNGPYFEAMSFIDAQNGWVVCSDSNGSNGRTIYRTRDGGTTWTNLPAFSASYGTIPRTLTFTDALHGWAISYYGDCFQTDDGGLSWQTLPSLGSYSFGRFAMRPSGAGLALGGTGRLAYVPALGARWARRDSTAFGNDISTLDPGKPDVRGLTFCDPVHGWAFSQPEVRVSKLLRTANRGKSWQCLDLPTLTPTLLDWPNSFLQTAAFPDADTAFAAVRTYVTLPGGYTWVINILKSTDAGRTWRRLPAPPGATDVADLRFYNGQRGLLVGKGGGVWLTEDGGQSWRTCPRVTTKSLFVVRWADARTAYIGGDSTAFLRSTDAGRTWQLEPAATTALFFRDRGIYQLVVISPQVLAVNSYFRVTDGGRTWNPFVWPQGVSQFNSWSFCSPTKGWAFGYQMYRTATAGRTWVPFSNVGNLVVTDGSQLIDPYNGWLPTKEGGLLHYSEKFLTARPLAQTRHCAGGSLALAFDTTGQFPGAERRFAAQLSNARGRFRPGQIRTVGQGTASPLAVTLPFDLPAGSAYRLRVVQADSLVLGADNGQDITINAAPVATLAPAGPQTLCAGSTLTLSAPAGLAQYLWSTGATTRTLAVTAGGSYTVRVAGAGGCFGPPSAAAVVTAAAVPAVPVIRQSAGGQLAVTPLAGATYQWSNGSGPLPGATAAAYPTTGAAPVGRYTVVVTSAAGCASAPAAPFAVVLAARLAGAADFGLYPNPTHAAFTVERPAGGGAARVAVYDALGRCPWQGELRAGQTRLAVPALPGGTYVVQLRLADGTVLAHRLVAMP